MRLRYAVSALALVTALTAAACGGSSNGNNSSGSTSSATAGQSLLGQIRQRGVLRVGAYDYPPYSASQGSQWTGFFAPMTKALAQKLGVSQVKPVFLTPAAFIPALNSGRVDLLLPLSYTTERAKSVTYPTYPMMTIPDCLLSKTNSGINKLSDLNGKTIGVTRGSVGESILKKFEARGLAKPKSVVTYDTYTAPLLDIQSGRIDAMVWDVVGAAGAKKANPNLNVQCAPIPPKDEKGFYSAPVFWLLPKSNSAALKAAVDQADLALTKDGTFKHILQQAGYYDPRLLSLNTTPYNPNSP